MVSGRSGGSRHTVPNRSRVGQHWSWRGRVTILETTSSLPRHVTLQTNSRPRRLTENRMPNTQNLPPTFTKPPANRPQTVRGPPRPSADHLMTLSRPILTTWKNYHMIPVFILWNPNSLHIFAFLRGELESVFIQTYFTNYQQITLLWCYKKGAKNWISNVNLFAVTRLLWVKISYQQN